MAHKVKLCIWFSCGCDTALRQEPLYEAKGVEIGDEWTCHMHGQVQVTRVRYRSE